MLSRWARTAPGSHRSSSSIEYSTLLCAFPIARPAARKNSQFNLLAFLFHAVLDLCDEQTRRVRAELATRQTFFNDVQALTRIVRRASLVYS